MKKVGLLAVVLIMLACGAGAISSDLKDTCVPKETLIGKISGAVLSSISREQVDLVKDGHIGVAFEYDIKKLGDQYYIWLNAPQNPGNYTLKITDIVTLVGGVPQIVDYEKNFKVEGALTDYSINPGFIDADEDFEIDVTLYEDAGKQIGISFPEQRTVNLLPGVNPIHFSIEGIIGLETTTITVGKYSVPAYISGAEYICGDGRIDGGEVCDGENLNEKNCETISVEYSGGELGCSDNCLSWDTDGCEIETETCGLEHLSLCTTESNCTSVKGYWYNNTCNLYEQGALCDSDHPRLCKTAGTCLDAEGFWYDSLCHETPEQICGDGKITGNESCDGSDLGGQNCTSRGYDYGSLTCFPAGQINECTFNFSKCFMKNEYANEFSFAINPGVIRDTIFVSDEIPSYTFAITNKGENEISNLVFDYDQGRFVISPDENVSLEPNETVSFTLTLKEAPRNLVRGVVVVYAGETYEYMLFNINLTTDPEKVGRQYSKNNSAGGASYYCSELSAGKFCSSDETCSTTEVTTLDGSCCTGECQSVSGGWSKAWIGYLIAGILILVLLIFFVKYRKTKSGGNPLGARVAQVERNLP
jgi:hypothetical protein